MRLYRECIRLDSLFYGQSKAVVDSTLQLVGVFQRKGEMDEAERLNREGLEILRGDTDVLPEDVAFAICQLAVVVQENKKAGEAEELFHESLSLLHKRTGAAVQHIVDTAMGNLAVILLEKGSLNEAEVMYREWIDVGQHISGDDFNCSEVLNQLGVRFVEASALDDASRIFDESLATSRKVHSENVENADVSYALHQLAVVAEKKGELDRAEQLYRESLDMSVNLCG